MSQFKCFVCFQSSTELSQNFKPVVTDFVRVFNKFHSYRDVTNLVLCKSCWIYLMRIHQFDGHMNKKTRDVKFALVVSKIEQAQAQRSSQEDADNSSGFEDLDAQTLTTKHADKISFKAESSDLESISVSCCSPKASNDVSSTVSLTLSGISAQKELAEQASADTSDSDSKTEPVRPKQLLRTYEDKWLPKNATLRALSPLVKRLSDTDFIYLGKYPFKGTEFGFKCGLCSQVSLFCFYKSSALWYNMIGHIRNRHMAGPSTAIYEDNWLPKNVIIRSSHLIKRLSERNFIYMDKYPFEGTEYGFKCGLCPTVCTFYTYKTYAPWHNIIKHARKWHLGDHKVRTYKTFQRCIEVAPNRFQYGKYSIEKIDGKYQCGECGILKVADGCKSDKQYILDHIINEHENPSRTYVCEHCWKVYNQRNTLRVHKITKHEQRDGQFPCTDCSKIFKSHSQVVVHQKRVHLKVYVHDDFICEICGKKFGKKDVMEDHVAFVHNGQRVKCKDCGKMFASKAALGIHRNVHTGKTKYICDICGMNFTQHYSVTRHKKTAHET